MYGFSERLFHGTTAVHPAPWAISAVKNHWSPGYTLARRSVHKMTGKEEQWHILWCLDAWHILYNA